MGKSSAMSSLSQWTRWSTSKRSLPKISFAPRSKKDKTGGVTLEEEDIVVSNVKIDLSRGRNNPLQSIKFFKDYDSNEIFSIEDDPISHLLPAFYQDMIVRVYSKKPELVEAVSEAFENFQLKNYGMKAQVHSTPDSKKQCQR